MNSFVLRQKVASATLLIACVFAGLLGWEECAECRGRLVAHFDLAQGHIAVIQMGKPAPAAFQAEYVRLMHDRYGVEVRDIPGCTPPRSLFDYAGGYDIVMVKVAKQKFGHDIFTECLREAARSSRARKA